MRVTGVVPTPLIVSCISWDFLVNYYYPTGGTGGIQSGPKRKYCLLSHPNSASCGPAHWPTVTGKMTLPFQISLDDTHLAKVNRWHIQRRNESDKECNGRIDRGGEEVDPSYMYLYHAGYNSQREDPSRRRAEWGTKKICWERFPHSLR